MFSLASACDQKYGLKMDQGYSKDKRFKKWGGGLCHLNYIKLRGFEEIITKATKHRNGIWSRKQGRFAPNCSSVSKCIDIYS